MNSEYQILRHQPEPFTTCPHCGKPFVSFLRGKVQRGKRRMFIGPRRDYYAVICRECKEIVGYESPPCWLRGHDWVPRITPSENAYAMCAVCEHSTDDLHVLLSKGKR